MKQFRNGPKHKSCLFSYSEKDMLPHSSKKNAISNRTLYCGPCFQVIGIVLLIFICAGLVVYVIRESCRRDFQSQDANVAEMTLYTPTPRARTSWEWEKQAPHVCLCVETQFHQMKQTVHPIIYPPYFLKKNLYFSNCWVFGQWFQWVWLNGDAFCQTSEQPVFLHSVIIYMSVLKFTL